MSLPVDSLLRRGFSRRQIGRIASLITAGATIPFYNEYAMAQQATQQTLGARRDATAGRAGHGPHHLQRESHGPLQRGGLEALMKVAPMGWRYNPQGENLDFQSLLEKSEGVKQGYAVAYPGSSIPLANAAPAFCSPTRPWVMGQPGYGAGGPPTSATRSFRSRCARISRMTWKR